MIMLRTLAARVKKPVGIFWSGLFAIKPPSHLSNKENLGFAYSVCATVKLVGRSHPFAVGADENDDPATNEKKANQLAELLCAR